MSFTTDIKRELTKTAPETREARLALLQAVFRTSGVRTADGFAFISENETATAYVIGIAEQCFGVRMTLTEAVRDPKHGRDKLTFSYTGPDAVPRMREILSQDIDTEDCSLAFLKGAFLGGGSCMLPRGENRTGYHLEVVFSERTDAELFTEVLDGSHLLGSLLERGERYVVYCKSREGIGDYLSVLGAEGCLRAFERTVAARDESNNRNRLENCVAGNVDRSVSASARQIRYLEALGRTGALATLPEPLRLTAEARIQNPTLTYSELAKLLGISKSCLQHRLKKIMSYQGERP